MTAEAGAGLPVVSVIVCARNERENLPVLYERLRRVMDEARIEWEWIVVDDHSRDGTFDWVARETETDTRIRAVRFSRHFGSHVARTCGLQYSRGACAITLAADLQDPPELIPQFLARWREGVQVVSSVRSKRPGEKTSTVWFSRLYQAILRRILPAEADTPVLTGFCLLDRRVVDAYCRLSESHSNSLALIRWMGFRTGFVEYVQERRLHGSSNWTLGMKVNLVLDTVTGFGYLPVRIISVTGLGVIVLGLVAGGCAFVNACTAASNRPLAALLAVILALAGMQMLMLGLLGEYLWRTLADARRRPQFLIEATAGLADPYSNPSIR
ncbi:MAG: glycosyltransferase family 2 protein [Bryobacterales bacterium]|nr:glycosyltransferase family 2 protein [Bryobacterales bacterium]